MKLDYKKTFLIGFGFFGISVLWTLYNAYVPIYLQTGNPTFDAPGEVGFGLGQGLTGVIMTLDNIACAGYLSHPPNLEGKIRVCGWGLDFVSDSTAGWQLTQT